MSCIIENKFQHINNYIDQLILNTLEINLKSFLDYAFLSIGAWTDINFSQDNIYQVSSPSKLVAVSDPSFTNGTVWESFRKEWVWETGPLFNGQQPVVPSISVNGNSVTNFSIDYTNGRVIFNNSIPASANVTAFYSYRNIQVVRANDAPWWRQLQFGSLKPEEISNQLGSWNIGPHHRVQMPSIVIESVPRSRNLPYELGSKSLVVEQDVIFNILAENINDRNQILDIIRLQQDNNIYLYDINKVARNDKYPLNYLGNKNINGLSYNEMVNQYKWGKIVFKNVSLSEVQSINLNLHEGLARVTFEIIFDGFNT